MPKQKSVLFTSLTSGHSENVRNMYWENPTVNGDIIGVFQPSHEEQQHTDETLYNRKAWAEMYLLSLCVYVLVTSARSTFGYAAQGLGGLKPWILLPVQAGESDNAGSTLRSVQVDGALLSRSPIL
ncbi:galactoside 2-alpha-L-fucosyltransferase-like [Pyrus ussuriensis x Pyrus communis]|uniref:Fucosyltransferase n=1 Tax=Pyrus ussuriensis x Pyrus communis TaxID=2448454 RepID=A0A5N5HGE5_9ROSA|nr:galactoside 2-alpha-L-fucosyltransferase-like [Pyrus ussuriensis x Pyrus communis]